MKRFLAAISLALVASCTSMGIDADAQIKTLVTACNSAAAVENSVAGYIRSGYIKPASFPAIDQFRIPIKAFCDPSVPPPKDPVAAVRQVLAATEALSALQPK